MRVSFICKVTNYIVWINDKRVQFENGEYTTDDPEIIEGIRRLSDFGKIIFVNDGPVKNIDDLVPNQEENQRKFYCKEHNLYFNNRAELCKHLRTVHMIHLVGREVKENDVNRNITRSENNTAGANK